MVRRWASTRALAAGASGIVSRAIDHLSEQGASLAGRPSAVAGRVLLVRGQLRDRATSIRQIEYRVVAEAVLAPRRLGHKPFTLALREPHPTGGLGEGDDAAEATSPLLGGHSLHLPEKEGYPVFVRTGRAGVAGGKSAREAAE